MGDPDTKLVEDARLLSLQVLIEERILSSRVCEGLDSIDFSGLVALLVTEEMNGELF